MKSILPFSLCVVLAGAGVAQNPPTLSFGTDTAVGVFARDGQLVDVELLGPGTPIPIAVALDAQAGGGKADLTAAPHLSTGLGLGVQIVESAAAVRQTVLSDPSAGTTSINLPVVQLASPHSFSMRLIGALQGKLRVTLTGDAQGTARASAAVDINADGALEFVEQPDGVVHIAEFPISSAIGIDTRITMFGFADTDPGRLAAGYRMDLTVEFRPDLPCAITQYGQGCGPTLNGNDTLRGNNHVFDFHVAGAFPNFPVTMVFGDRPIAVRIPGTNCPLLALPQVLINIRADANGDARMIVPVVGPMAGEVFMQALPFRLSTTMGIEVTSSNGLKVDCGM